MRKALASDARRDRGPTCCDEAMERRNAAAEVPLLGVQGLRQAMVVQALMTVAVIESSRANTSDS